jgi:hypothetical protein
MIMTLYLPEHTIKVCGKEFVPKRGDHSVEINRDKRTFHILSTKEMPRELTGRPIYVWGPPPALTPSLAKKLPYLAEELKELYPDPDQRCLVCFDNGEKGEGD